MGLNNLIRKRDSLQRKKIECLNKILQISKNFKKIEKEKGYGRASLNYANACKNVDRKRVAFHKDVVGLSQRVL